MSLFSKIAISLAFASLVSAAPAHVSSSIKLMCASCPYLSDFMLMVFLSNRLDTQYMLWKTETSKLGWAWLRPRTRYTSLLISLCPFLSSQSLSTRDPLNNAANLGAAVFAVTASEWRAEQGMRGVAEDQEFWRSLISLPFLLKSLQWSERKQLFQGSWRIQN